MIKMCEICNEQFDANNKSRIYCYKCIDALEFHHENPQEKEFKLGSGNTMAWKEYKSEALKCKLVCSNCHKEIHSKMGYIF